MQTIRPSKTLGFTLGITLALTSLSRAGYDPIPLTPGSFTHDIVVENTAPPPLSMATTATVDAGTNNSGNTWYEIGYNTAALNTGLPAAGSTLTDTNGGNHHWQMPPTYAANNVLMVGHHSGAGSPMIISGTLTLTTPATFTHLSFLNSSGNGAVPLKYVIHYADASTEEGVFSVFDWFNTTAQANSATAYNPAGRVSISGGGFANVDNTRATSAARLFFNDFPIGNSAVNVTSIDFVYNGFLYNNGRAVILAVAGSTDGTTFNPVPVTGFNHDAIVEAGSFPNTALTGFTTGTMDGGGTNNGNVWYEQGYYSRFPTTGLPPSGSTFASAGGLASYTLGSYTANNAAILDMTNTTANLTPVTPAAYGGLSFLVSGANTPTPLRCVVQFQDGTTETNALTVTDWFNNNPYAYANFGRVNRDNRSVNNTPDQAVNPPIDIRTVVASNPRLYDSVVPIVNSASAVTNILLIRTNPANNLRAVVMAVSGVAAGSMPPVVSNPVGLKTNEAKTFLLSTTLRAGTGPVTYQWRKAPKGGGINNVFDYSTFANVSDAGNVFGATSNVLAITNAVLSNSGDYILVASNPYGSYTSQVATVTILTTNPVITLPTDPVTAYQPNGGSTPAAETVQRVIDGRTFKYLNFGASNNAVAAFGGPVGFIVTPQSGASIVTSLRFTTANDTAGRDPSDYKLEGSNDGGANWTIITTGILRGTLALPTARNNADDPLNIITQNNQEVDFANSAGYKAYRVSFTNVYTPNAVNSMQIGEVELLGALVPNPPVFTRLPSSTVTVYAGASATFSVAVAGYPNPTFQWKSNNIIIPGATGSSYTFPNAQLSDSGRTFSCTASNIFGVTNSPLTTLQVIAPPTTSYPSAVLADNPIAFFPLGEVDDSNGNNGATAIDYRGGHNGIYTNTILSQPGYNPGIDPDTAAQFGVLQVADSFVGGIQDLSFASPTNTTVNFSVEAWVKGPAQALDAGIITKGIGAGGEQFNLDTGSGTNHAFRFFFRDAGGGTHGAGGTATLDGNWHHVVGVCNQSAGSVALYVDGILAGSGTASPSNGVLTSLFPVSIGSRQSAAGNFNNQFIGTIDDVAIYNVALSSNQVLAHFFASHPAPVYTLQPTNQTVNEATTVTLASSAYGPSPLGYEWYRSLDGGGSFSLTGGNTNNLVIPSISSTINGSQYYVVATNIYGSTTSAVVTITVLSGPPSITADLSAQIFLYAGKLVLAPGVGGTAPFTYQWTSNGIPMADSARISGATSNVLVILNSLPTDSATYQLSVVNGQGGPVTTTAAQVTVQSVPQFNVSGSGWTQQSSADPVLPMTTGSLQLTSTNTADDNGGRARSAFYNTPLYIRNFRASFVYQDVGGLGADGTVFCIHNDARRATALGAGGGSLGYAAITPSVGLAINIFANNTPGIQLLQNGTLPAAGAAAYAPITPVNPASGNPIRVDAVYNGTVLNVTFTDLTTLSTFTTNVTVNIPGIIGASTGYIGFCGADGGTLSQQVVSNFTFVPIPTLAVQNGVGSMSVTWPQSIGGFVLQSRSTVVGGSWSSTTEPVSAVGTDWKVIVSPITGNNYYRLALP